jgi:hypothetical protein
MSGFARTTMVTQWSLRLAKQVVGDASPVVVDLPV